MLCYVMLCYVRLGWKYIR